jgi:NitT/TauT family transport system permease protein
MALWEVAGILLNNQLMLPRLSVVLTTGWEMARSGVLIGDLTISLQRALTGFALAVLIGVPLGTLMAWFKRWDTFWSVIISFTNPMPKIALVPLFILWLGIGEASKISVIAAAAVFPILINTYSGVRGVNRHWVWRARTMGASEWEIVTRVIIPAALPHILTGTRLAMALAMVLLIAAEMIGANAGLGYRILYSEQIFNTPAVFVGLLTISTVGLLFDRLVQMINVRVCGWYFRLGDKPDA